MEQNKRLDRTIDTEDLKCTNTRCFYYDDSFWKVGNCSNLAWVDNFNGKKTDGPVRFMMVCNSAQLVAREK